MLTVDANQVRRDSIDADTVQNDVSWSAIVCAVTAAAIELADVDVSAASDGHSATTIVLDDLVNCVLGTTSFDQDVAVSKS